MSSKGAEFYIEAIIYYLLIIKMSSDEIKEETDIVGEEVKT